MKNILWVLLLCFSTQNMVFGQFYETGQEPASIHWKQIKTHYFRLVYPDYAEQQAQHFANKLLWAAQQVPKGLNHQAKCIDIIMHMEASTSNALVVWAPKRMEAYNTPSQSSYSQDWWEQLALHEFRHVVQVSKMRQGFTKILSYFFGEAATGGILGAYIPLWFLEGDAVATETALSQTGRGRDPDFSKDLKAQLLEKGTYSYDKAYNGSYKDYIPDHYVLGYHLSTLGQQIYGDDFWSNTLDYTASKPFMMVPFSHSIKKQSGLTKTQFYSEILLDLKNKWELKQKQKTYSDFDTLVYNTHKTFRSFTNPNLVDSNTIISLITAIDDITRISKINTNNGDIEILHTPGYGVIDNLSVGKDLVVWNEQAYHPRWQHRKYMVIKSYNLRTKKVKQLTHRTRYFFPNLDSEGKRIVVVEVSKTNNYKLVILDAHEGKILKTISSKNFLKAPFFSSDGKSINVVEIGNKGSSIVQYNIKEGSRKVVFGPSFDKLSHPNSYQQQIVFISSKSGTANAHAIDLKTGEEWQLTSVPYGISNLSVANDSLLIFNSYSANGELIAMQKIKTFRLAKKEIDDDFYKSYLSADKGNIQSLQSNDSIFTSTRYHKFPHLIKLHSWAPIGLNFDNIQANPGFTFASQNLLTSMVSTFGYEYRMNNQTSRYYANFSYKGWYPLIDFNIEHEDLVGSLKHPSYTERYTFNSTSLGLSIIQGLNLSRGKYSNYLQASFGAFYQIFNANPGAPNDFPSGTTAYSLRYRFYAQHKLKKGLRDIETRWGQSIDVQIRNTYHNVNKRANIISAAVRLYFPGVMPHHTSRFYFASQIKENDAYFTPNDQILMPRGYTGIVSDFVFGFRFDYIFPVFYPDFSLGSLGYFKRLKAAVFYDLGAISKSVPANTPFSKLQTYGLDLTTDVHFLRHMTPFDIGLRTAYLYTNRSMYYELLFGINL